MSKLLYTESVVGSHSLDCATTLGELLDVELALCRSAQERIDVLDRLLAVTRDWAKLFKQPLDTFKTLDFERDYLRLKDFGLKIEIALLTEKAAKSSK